MNTISFKQFEANTPKEWIQPPNGWLSPKGNLYLCSNAFCHANLAIKTPEIKKVLSEEGVNLFLKNEDSSIIYNDAWKANFLRVSHYAIDPLDAWPEYEIHFEGTSEGIKLLYQKAKNIADDLNMKAVFTKVSL